MKTVILWGIWIAILVASSHLSDIHHDLERISAVAIHMGYRQ